MKDRILKVMEYENANPARFAEAIGIQRSAMSHIISGRNNPSLDVLLKIMAKYSYLNTEWLLKGEGSMFKSEKDEFQRPLFDEHGVNTPTIQVASEKSLDSIVEHSVSKHKYADSEGDIYIERGSKNVRKIMVFYSDNTFETFIPEKSKIE